jgi:hypothetical protein
MPEDLTAMNVDAAAVFWDVALCSVMAGATVIQRNLLPLSSLSYPEGGDSSL